MSPFVSVIVYAHGGNFCGGERALEGRWLGLDGSECHDDVTVRPGRPLLQRRYLLRDLRAGVRI